MRIAVIGAGAVGGSLGVRLSRGGHEVILIGRPAQVAAIRKDGLHVDGYLGEFTANVEAAELLESPPDLALLAVKTQDVIAAVRDNAPRLAGIPLVTLQNGLRSDDMVASILPPAQVIGGVVMMSATYLTPGRVTLVDSGNVIIGRPFGPRDAKLDEVAGILDRAVPTHVTDNIRSAHWTKLMINLNNALPAMTNLPVNKAYIDKRLSRLAMGLMREGMQVADHVGVRLESLPGLRASSLRLLCQLPIGVAAGRFAARYRYMWTDQVNFGSTLQSIKRGRSTEIDYLNGEIVRLGQETKVPTPLNAKTVELVHRVEQSGRFLSVDEVMGEMGGG